MKKTILFAGLLLMHLFASASVLKPQTSATAYDHLSEVNAQWKSRSLIFSSKSIHFATDIDRIQFHLLQVESLLRTSDVGNLTQDQAEKRFQMLDVLHDYAVKGKFPINSFHSERRPYFIDVYGTHCAVGYLVKMSGFGHVSRAISQSQNYAYVKEIQSKKLLDWSREYGFSVEELALIQPTYGPSESYEQIQQGANGNVSVMRTIHDNQSGGQAVFIAGEFTTLNDLPCLSIGKYVDNQLSCLGDGISGKVVEITKEVNNIVATGEFMHNGSIYPIAVYNGSSWSYEAIPGRPNSKATASFYNFYPSPTRKVAINHPTDPGKQEIWEYKNAAWNLFATVNGTVYVINSNVYAGAFDEITLNTMPETILESKNAIIQDYGNEWITIDDHVSDTIFTVYSENQMIYFGGSGSTQPNRSNVCVSRYLNGVCQPLVLAGHFDDGYAVIHDIDYYTGSDLILVGQFSNYELMAMYLGNNIMRLDKASNYMHLMSTLNNPVRSFARIGNSLLFGGEFTGNLGVSEPLNHLVKMKSGVGLDELESEADFTISPNPSSGIIEISGSSKIKSVSVSDLQGKKWMDRTTASEMLDGSDLPAGVYLIRIESEKGNFQTIKWMKN